MLIHTTQYREAQGRQIVLSVPAGSKVPKEMVQGVNWMGFALSMANLLFAVINGFQFISGATSTPNFNFAVMTMNIFAFTLLFASSHFVGHLKTQYTLTQLRQRKGVIDLSVGAESRSLIREIPGMTERYPELQDLSSGFKEADERLVRAVLLDPIARDACALLAEDIHGKLTAVAKADLCADIQNATANVGEAEALEDTVNLRAFRITGKDPFRQELEE